MDRDADTIDLYEVGAAVRRGWRWIAASALGGSVLALLVTLLLPSRYEGEATVLLRGASDARASALSQLGDGLGEVLAGSMPSGFETEMEILVSRGVMEEVIDSLLLQARVVAPRDLPPTRLFASGDFAPDVPRGTYTFELDGAHYSVDGPAGTATAVPGVPFNLPGISLTLLRQGLPDEFEVEILERDETLRWLEGQLDVEKAGGEVASVTFAARSPMTAAAVPNMMIDRYLARRQTADRGSNQRRYEFLLDKGDSISRELAVAESALLSYQESSGVSDPGLQRETELIIGLRSERETLGIEARSLRELLDLLRSGDAGVRDLAAYPTFLRNPAINDLLSELLRYDAERTALLERRPEFDSEVMSRTKTIAQLEAQLVSLARAYLSNVDRQREQLDQDLSRYQSTIDALPALAQASMRLQREVNLLSAMEAALGVQLLQARVGAIGEGGDVRIIDRAVPPQDPAFPRPLLNLGLGLLAGLVLGFGVTLRRAYFGTEVRSPFEAHLATGVPIVPVGAHTSLFIAGAGAWKTVLVTPTGEAAEAMPVCLRIAEAVALQGRASALVILDNPAAVLGPESTGSSTAVTRPASRLGKLAAGSAPVAERVTVIECRDPYEAQGVVADAEERFSFVVVALQGLDAPSTMAVLSPERPVILVARMGDVSRANLREQVDTLVRAGLTVPGLILQDSGSNGSGHA